MVKPCFICKKEIPSYSIREHHLDDLKEDMKPIPEGMTTDDKICNTCFKSLNTKKKSVSVFLQAVLSLFLPFFWIYALCRIEKFRKGVIVYVIIFSIGMGMGFGISSILITSTDNADSEDFFGMLSGLFAVIGIFGSQITLFVLIIKWSLEWNKNIGEFNP